ncbi:MAG: hypothetical protein RIS35_1612 [Pseudomonadota bacterium]|jgi:predicted metal-dependent hydrolase
MKRLGRQIVDAARQFALPWLEPSPGPTVAPRPSVEPTPGAGPVQNPLTPRVPAIPAGELREVRLSGHPVQYLLRRSPRKTIGFAVDHRGLTVTAPRRVSLREIESALAVRGDWVLRKLVEWREAESRRAEREVRWEHGAPVPFLGRPLTLQVDPGHRGTVLRVEDRLHLALPPGAGSEQIRDAFNGWIQAQARAHYAQRIAHFSQRLGVAPKRWRLSSARTRWGSCSADGSIRLNWRLMHFPPEIVDYVVCHELAHLKELNHGPRFWSTVGELFPEYPQAREWLRKRPGGTSAA